MFSVVAGSTLGIIGCLHFFLLYDYEMLVLQRVSMALNEICSPFKLFETYCFANNA